MIKIFITVLICFVNSCIAKENAPKSKADMYVDSLLSPVYSHSHMDARVEQIVGEIYSDSEHLTKTSELLKFAINNHKYNYIVMRLLVKIRHPEMPQLIRENYMYLDESCYSKLYRALNWSYGITDSALHNEYNQKIVNALLDVVNDVEDQYSRGYIYNVIRAIGTHEQVTRAKPNIHLETNARNRAELLSAFLRYNEKYTEQVVVHELQNKLDHWIISYVLRYGFQRFNRHDFLPFLYSLQTELENETDVRKIEDAKRTLERLNEVIPYLEQKKAEGVKLGLPLDWGVVD
ncbi:hypothetical protein QA601_16260 [Chitinispirillales bacterium ANBcel5]|uniref:hypothetical protein n=1 Tax=Cellulosispirillum alkaliphilum TaxID=3039283 RepID=UPI002A4F06B4|nr:hypothetical protein [Chitinispirillales bacterium ANBcel5]